MDLVDMPALRHDGLNLDNEALYLVTFMSFVCALGYFLLECFVYHTMAVKNVASLFFFAGSSLLLSLLNPFFSAGKTLTGPMAAAAAAAKDLLIAECRRFNYLDELGVE